MRIPPSVFPPLFFYLWILFLSGCSPSSPPAIATLAEAHQKFLKLCKEEYNLAVVLKPLPSTLWIYLPVTENIIEYKASLEGAPRSAKPTQELLLHYVDGHFENETFHVEYDIVKGFSDPSQKSLKSFYTEEFQRKQNNLLTALFRSYSDLDLEKKESASQKGGPYLEKTDAPPPFVVLVASDIKRGVEAILIFSFEDFRYTMTGLIPQEEFALRSITEFRGGQGIVADEEGRHLALKEMTWPEFLTKQILNRIRFKYQTSDFKPSDDAETEILTIVAQTLKAYSFGDFTSVRLHNLRSDQHYLFNRSQLETFLK